VWPVAKRVASKLPTAPPAKRAMNSAASSTVTGPRAAAAGQRPLAHERLGQRRHPGDAVAGQVLGQVDGVGAEVAEGARPRVLGLEPPEQGELGVEDMAGQVGAADVADGAEAAGGDQLTGQGDGRHPAEVEADHRPDARGGGP